MALQESFTDFDGSLAFFCYGTRWYMQTFTTTSAYTITDVELNCWKFGSPGNITVGIREIVAGKPVGDDLCSVTVADSEISTLPTLAYYKFTFDDSYALDDATQYAIVARAPSGDAGNYFQALGYGSSGYADGGSALSIDSGNEWGTVSTTTDANFRTYGGTPSPGKPTTPSPADAASSITLDETPLGWVSGGDTDTYEIYYRAQGDSWTLVGVAQAGLTWTIPFGSIVYGITYEWRIDATNAYDTTIGDTWSFDSIVFDQIRVSYRLISGGNGRGPYDSPPGVQGTDWEYTGESNMTTIKRLVAAANSKIWYESI